MKIISSALLGFFCTVALGDAVTSFTVEDHKRVTTQLDIQFKDIFEQGVTCKVQKFFHNVILDVEGDSFSVRSRTYFQCKGEFRKQPGEICDFAREEGQWILEYCDS